MNTDEFFSKRNCDRCGSEMKARTMSWFTEETICMDCSIKEDEIKRKLRSKGDDKAHEGCGYIPEV